MDEGGKGAVCWLREREKTERTWGKEKVGTNFENNLCVAMKKGFVQCIIKQLLDEVFVISRIIKVSVRVINLSLRLCYLDLGYSGSITKTSSNNCLKAVADPGEGPPPPPYFRPTWSPMGRKKFFGRPPLFFLGLNLPSPLISRSGSGTEKQRLRTRPVIAHFHCADYSLPVSTFPPRSTTTPNHMLPHASCYVYGAVCF